MTFWVQVLQVVMNYNPKTKATPCTAKAVAEVSCADADFGFDIEYSRILDGLQAVDYVPLPLHPSSGLAQLLVLVDNEAVIEMCNKGRSVQMRHIARTHRIDIDWLFERV